MVRSLVLKSVGDRTKGFRVSISLFGESILILEGKGLPGRDCTSTYSGEPRHSRVMVFSD